LIPAQVIAAWRTTHPWVNDRQVEQDLILTRLAIEISGHPELRDRLVWRGGTCLHKIVMPEPLRYSEDLDYVAFGIGGADFGPILSALREVAGRVGLNVARTTSKRRKLEIRLRFDPAGGGPAANIKVEINIDEVESLLALERRNLRIDTAWWSGENDVLTFHPAEMIGTKFRALAQRSKGRDLNDLALAHLYLGLDDAQLAACAAHYLDHEGISSNEFKERLFAHLSDPNFVDDVARFITDPSLTFEPDRLVEQWIWWSDEHLDAAWVRLRTAAVDGLDAEGLIRQRDFLREGRIRCAVWIERDGGIRRCGTEFAPGDACSEHR